MFVHHIASRVYYLRLAIPVGKCSEDTGFNNRIEGALNSENNAKGLFAHINRIRSHDNIQVI